VTEGPTSLRCGRRSPIHKATGGARHTATNRFVWPGPAISLRTLSHACFAVQGILTTAAPSWFRGAPGTGRAAPRPVPEMPAVSASPSKPDRLKVALTFRLGHAPDARGVLRPDMLQGITGDGDDFPANSSFYIGNIFEEPNVISLTAEPTYTTRIMKSSRNFHPDSAHRRVSTQR
jgi:hypothetical protein